MKSIKLLFNNPAFALFLWILSIPLIAWAADTKLSALDNLGAAPATSDELYLNDAGTSKALTIANLMLYLGAAHDTEAELTALFAAKEAQLNNEAGLYAVLSDVSNFMQDTENFTSGKTITAVANGDTTPNVAGAATGGAIYESDDNGTITNFIDQAAAGAGDEDDFANGDWFVFLVTDANTTIDFSENADIEGNAGIDWTGSASQITALLFIYENVRWNCVTLTTGMSSPTVLALSAIDMGGGDLEIPNGTDPDVDVTGQISHDTDGANEASDEVIRAYDGSAQFAVERKLKCFQTTVISPNDLDDSERDAFPFFDNNTGMVFTITEIKAWSDTDDTEVNVEVASVTNWSSPSTVDALDIDTDGTGVYTDTETAITDATIAHDEMVFLDFDDTDDPGMVKVSICGWYNADID